MVLMSMVVHDDPGTFWPPMTSLALLFFNQKGWESMATGDVGTWRISMGNVSFSWSMSSTVARIFVPDGLRAVLRR